ncbi:SsgA family sporulation/cell division regulator [Microbispora sp. CA-135349]|uniref:SsgA family sporulation/cell division regulator n=1 Tax=Microbispora sp. CA-135349 TaxID=3239953 RepID=UPI003D929E4A
MNASTSLVLHHVDRPDIALTAFLVYRTGDPYFVRLLVPGSPSVDVARTVLVEGANLPVESASLHLLPSDDPDWLLATVHPSSPDALSLWLPRHPLGAFLAETIALVPPGREGEHIDWDREFAALVSGFPGDEGGDERGY